MRCSSSRILVRPSLLASALVSLAAAACLDAPEDPLPDDESTTDVEQQVVAGWPAFGGVTRYAAPSMPAFAPPSYLDFRVDPRTTAFGDGRVVTEVARVSDGPAFGLPGRTVYGHQ